MASNCCKTPALSHQRHWLLEDLILISAANELKLLWLTQDKVSLTPHGDSKTNADCWLRSRVSLMGQRLLGRNWKVPQKVCFCTRYNPASVSTDQLLSAFLDMILVAQLAIGCLRVLMAPGAFSNSWHPVFICSCRVNSTANLWIRGRLSPAISQHTHPSLACYFLGTASPSILSVPIHRKRRPFQSKSSISSSAAAKMQYPVQVSSTGQMRLWWNISSPCLVLERSCIH